jgi:hypothetical protein
MNMVRAGVVEYPAQWRHSSAYDLASSRQRYRGVGRERLLERLEIRDCDAYRCWHDESLKEILRAKLFRECQPF